MHKMRGFQKTWTIIPLTMEIEVEVGGGLDIL